LWTVVYIASNRNKAEKLKDALVSEGLLVNLRGLGNDPDNKSKAVEILVPESEAEEANEIINGILSS
jgi:hypothetical protein